MKPYDAFISHASEDKDDFVRPLAIELTRMGLVPWYDEFSLKLGDNLRAEIDRGLASSKFGVVVLSQSFFNKKWTNAELDGLFALEQKGQKLILPVRHKISPEEVAKHSPMLAGRLSTHSGRGVESVAAEIFEVIRPNTPPPKIQNLRPEKPPISNQPTTERIHVEDLLQIIELTKPVLYQLDQHLEGKAAELFLQSLQGVFHARWLLCSSINEQLCWALDNLLRVASSSGRAGGYHLEKLNACSKGVEAYLKLNNPASDPCVVTEESIPDQVLRDLGMKLEAHLKSDIPKAQSDLLAVRFGVAVIRYTLFRGCFSKKFPLMPVRFNAALRPLLEHLFMEKLGVLLPDIQEWDNTDIRHFCRPSLDELG